MFVSLPVCGVTGKVSSQEKAALDSSGALRMTKWTTSYFFTTRLLLFSFSTPLILFLETLERKHVSQPESGSAVNTSVSFDWVETGQYINPLKAHFTWVCLDPDFKHIQTPTYIFLYMFLFLCSQRSQHQTAGLTHTHTHTKSPALFLWYISALWCFEYTVVSISVGQCLVFTAQLKGPGAWIPLFINTLGGEYKQRKCEMNS